MPRRQVVLDLLHELVPKAVRIAVLVNPTNTVTAESTLRDGQETAPALGLQVQAVEAGSIREIEAVFETIARERAEALFIGPDAFLISRRVQLLRYHLCRKKLMPVALPSGRARLVVKPSLTGSSPTLNAMETACPLV
jgi:ABC-type uncharacterized transport system substrate-binding protein